MDDRTEHTFGGSALDRHVFDFETVADAGDAGGVPAGAAPSGTTDAAPAAAVGGETDPPAVATDAPAWSPEQLQTDPTFRQMLADEASQIADARIAAFLEQQQLATQQQGAATQPGQGALVPPDPFSDNYAAEMAQYQQARDEQMFARFEQMLGQVARPLNAMTEAATVAEGNQRLQDMIADDVARNGDFPRLPGETESKAQQLVKPFAEMLFPQIAAQYGNSPRAAELAIQQASQTLRGIIAEAKAAGVAEHQNQLGTLAGARGDTPAGIAGAQGVADTLDPTEITRRYAEAGRAAANGA